IDTSASRVERLEQGDAARVGELLDLGAICQPKDQDPLVREWPDLALDLFDRSGYLVVVELSCPCYQQEIGRRLEQESWVDGDAVAADPESWRVNVRVRLAVRSRNDFSHIEAVAIGHACELVREGNIHVTVGRLRELGEFGR